MQLLAKHDRADDEQDRDAELGHDQDLPEENASLSRTFEAFEYGGRLKSGEDQGRLTP